MGGIFEGVSYSGSGTVGGSYRPCLSMAQEGETRIPNTSQVINDYKAGTIDLQTARNMFFTENDLNAIHSHFQVGLDSFRLSANRLPNDLIQMNGQMCYIMNFVGREEGELFLEEVQKGCRQALNAIGSLNVEDKCIAIENAVKSSIPEEDNTLVEIAITVLVVGFVAFGLAAPFGQDIYQIAKRGAIKLYKKYFGGDDNNTPSGGSRTTKSGIVIPTGGEVDRYGTRSEAVSWRGALDLYYQQNEGAMPNMVDSNTNLPGVVDGLGDLTSPSFIPAYPGSILGPLPSPNPMPSFKPIPRLVPIPR